MRKTLLLMTVWPLLACQQASVEKGIYTSWHCQDGKDPPDVQCEQAQMQNGQPVAVVANTVTQSPPQEKDRTRRVPLEIVWVGDNRPRAWQEQLPTFKADQPDSKAASPGPANLAVGSDAAPVPEVAYDDWRGEDVAVDAEIGHGSGAPASLVGATTGQSAAVSTISTPLKGRQYTVQLGAFASRDKALQYVRANRLNQLDVGIHEKPQAEPPGFVVTYGRFASRAAAQRAWQATAQSSAISEVWIRPLDE